jgi:hypothetical protein
MYIICCQRDNEVIVTMRIKLNPKLLSIALVIVMALTVVSGAGAMKASAAGARVPGQIIPIIINNPTQDQLATALESGALQWTYSATALQNEQFASFVGVLQVAGIAPLRDGDGVLLIAGATHNGTTYTPGANAATLKTTVTGPGTIGWWYGFETSIAPEKSRFGFWVDEDLRGVMYTGTSGFYTSYTIPDGEHTIKWEVSVDPTATYTEYEYFCMGSLNSVTWMPGSSLNQGAVVQAIKDFRQTLSPTDFKSPQAFNAYVHKVDAVNKMVEAGHYQGAIAKITNDLMRQTEDTTQNGELGTIVVYLTALQAAG